MSVEPFVPPVRTVPHDVPMESFREKRRGLELSVEPSDTPVSTVPHGVPMEGVKRREVGLRAECGAL